MDGIAVNGARALIEVFFEAGAPLACPDRTVFALLGDGGAMYANQYLWTAAPARDGSYLIETAA